MKATFLAIAFFTFSAPHGLAWEEDLTIPNPTSPYVDEVGLLESGSVGRVEQVLNSVNQSGKIQMAIYVAKSLRGRDIESFSMAVADQWKLGTKKQDNGLILLIAPNERKVRIEVGYGLEGEITDALGSRIIRNQIVPAFRAAQYEEGMLGAVAVIAEKLNISLKGVKIPQSSSNTLRLPFGVFGVLPLLLILGFIVFIRNLFRPRATIFGRRRGHYGIGGWGGGGGSSWGGGGFGGGFGGGGGGFGGGGSSGSW